MTCKGTILTLNVYIYSWDSPLVFGLTRLTKHRVKKENEDWSNPNQCIKAYQQSYGVYLVSWEGVGRWSVLDERLKFQNHSHRTLEALMHCPADYGDSPPTTMVWSVMSWTTILPSTSVADLFLWVLLVLYSHTYNKFENCSATNSTRFLL